MLYSVEHLKYDQLPPGYPTHPHPEPNIVPLPENEACLCRGSPSPNCTPCNPLIYWPNFSHPASKYWTNPQKSNIDWPPLWTKTFGASTPTIGHFHRHSLAWIPWARQRNLHLSFLKLSMSFSLFMKIRGQLFTMNYGTGKYGQKGMMDQPLNWLHVSRFRCSIASKSQQGP